MHIEWKITKKRGYMRPILQYSVRLEEHEKALALPIVSIVSTHSAARRRAAGLLLSRPVRTGAGLYPHPFSHP